MKTKSESAAGIPIVTKERLKNLFAQDIAYLKAQAQGDEYTETLDTEDWFFCICWDLKEVCTQIIEEMTAADFPPVPTEAAAGQVQ